VEDLNFLYKPKFIESDGLVLLEWQFENFKRNALSSGKRCPEDNELFLSVTAILDHFENDAELDDEPWYDTESDDFDKAWNVAKELVTVWGEVLVTTFPTYRFYVSAHKFDQPKVKFFRVREESAPDIQNSNECFSLVFKAS
jgi:hypothetical protein